MNISNELLNSLLNELNYMPNVTNELIELLKEEKVYRELEGTMDIEGYSIKEKKSNSV
jgi:hypothetical protein